MYYYGARYYDPRISIFVSVDPLAESTMTPYQYVHQNPINLIDPTGMSAEGLSPIYGLDGKYLGNDENGFEGEVLFMDEKMYFFLGGRGNIDTNEKGTISHKDAKTFGRTLDQVITNDYANNFDKNDINMVNNALTHIVSQMDDAGSLVKDLHNGKTSAYFADLRGPNDWYVQSANEGNRYKYGEGGSLNAPGYFNQVQKKFTFNLSSRIWRYEGNFTVGNIQNHAVHELLGHFRDKITGEGRGHVKAYDLQINHPTWKSTTPNYRQETLGGRELQLLKK